MLLSSLMTSFCLQSNVLTNVQASQNAKMGSITLLDHFQDWLPMKLFLDDFSNIVFFRFFHFEGPYEFKIVCFQFSFSELKATGLVKAWPLLDSPSGW